MSQTHGIIDLRGMRFFIRDMRIDYDFPTSAAISQVIIVEPRQILNEDPIHS